MSVDYGLLMSALDAESYPRLADQLRLSSLADTIEIALIAGPYRTLELAYRSDRRFKLRAPFTSPMPWKIVAPPLACFPDDMLVHWLDTLATRVYHSSMSGQGTLTAATIHDVLARQMKLSADLVAAEHVRVTRNVTGTLPQVSGVPLRITDADYAAVAARHNVQAAAVKAIAEVESHGDGFDADNRPKILFEGHQFRKHTHHAYDRTHPHLSMPYGQQRAFYRWQQYPHLFEALLLDPVAALKSASWGRFQIMGFNHTGWPDVTSFVQAMFESEVNHLKAFEAYCTERHIWTPMRSGNWAAVGSAYNGADSGANAYAGKAAAAYARAGGT